MTIPLGMESAAALITQQRHELHQLHDIVDQLREARAVDKKLIAANERLIAKLGEMLEMHLQLQLDVWNISHVPAQPATLQALELVRTILRTGQARSAEPTVLDEVGV